MNPGSDGLPGPGGAGPWVECVPNVSSGRDPACLAELVRTLESDPDLELLDASQDPDHHRAVFTFVARPARVVEATLRFLCEVIARVDLSGHSGVHPRIGAADVVPLVPLAGVELAHCAELARELGRRAGEELELPVFLYGAAARSPEREELPGARRAGRAFLEGGVDRPIPDEGPDRPHPTAGACAVGARKFLVAFNVDLEGTDPGPAKRIARRIRASGGGLPGVRALGLPLESAGRSQVSMNLVDLERVDLVRAYAEVERLAEAEGARLLESELIGLAPARVLDAEVARRVRLRGFHPDRSILERRLARVLGAD